MRRNWPYAILGGRQRHAAEQHGQLSGVDFNAMVVRRDDLERALFEPFVVEPKAGAVEVQNLQPIATPVDEQEEAAVERIGVEGFAHDSA
jgi:hypothetical protein